MYFKHIENYRTLLPHSRGGLVLSLRRKLPNPTASLIHIFNISGAQEDDHDSPQEHTTGTTTTEDLGNHCYRHPNNLHIVRCGEYRPLCVLQDGIIPSTSLLCERW